jgi:uncharacterized protein
MLFCWSPFFGTDYPAEIYGASREDVVIPVKNGKNNASLHGWLFQKPGAKQIAIVHHGQAGSIGCNLPFAFFWLQMDRSVLLYDYEGYGKSTGKATVEGICHDGETVYQWLIEERGYKPNQIVNVGISLGTGVASTVAERHPCAGVVLLAPYTSLHQLARHHLPWLNLYSDWLLDYPELGSKRMMTSAHHPPVLMLHGIDDSIIPVGQADALAKAAVQPVEYVRLKNTGHVEFFKENSPQTLRIIREFMDRLG